MSSAHLQLAAKGQEDRWLSESPDRTYFEAKYQPRVNRSRETYEVPLDNQGTTFGMTGRCTIPVKGDYLTRLTLRAVFPPIYPTVEGEYVYPTPSSQVGGSVYANMGLTLVVADGVTLTANTVGNHYMSVGTAVTLSGTTYNIFDLDGTYTVTSIPTANSFTCSTTLAGISYNGTMSFVGIACGDIISYFSTRNLNLWVNNLTNKTWQITGGTVVGSQVTFTTSAPSNFPVGSSVVLILPLSGIVNEIYTVTASTDTTFVCTINPNFVTVGTYYDIQAWSSNNGLTWNSVSSPLTGFWSSVAYGNGYFVMVGWFDDGSDTGKQAWSSDNGRTWNLVSTVNFGFWHGVAYGNGYFVMVGWVYGVGMGKQAWSSDNGKTWTGASNVSGEWYGVAYGNGYFVMVGWVSANGNQAWSSDNGQTWNLVSSPLAGQWTGVAYGNGYFVMVSSDGKQARSSDNGLTWNLVSSPLTGQWTGVTYGNGVFVMVSSDGKQARSSDNGQTWNLVSSPLSGFWRSVTYGNGYFVMVGTYIAAWSSDNGLTWNMSSTPFSTDLYGSTYGAFSYTNSPSDSVSLATPPLQLTNRVFSSDVYPSISFANASDAAFWGFDARNGLSYSLTATPPWTLTQSGWVSGFLPPSTSTWDDSVAHKLVRDARILVGKQTIKEYTGAYIELQNDLTVPYENKAILKLLNGTLDQTQATASREYYTTLPLGTKEIPLCALTHQQMSVEVDFEAFTNLSQNLNAGTGDFLDVKSYTTYNASTGILGGQPVNVQTTFSYQQYIFIVTYGGQFIVYDTTKDVADPTSYIVLSAFSGSSLFSQFCVLSGTLYIGLSNGKLLSIIIDELIQGNTSSSVLNNYAPTIGSLTGTLVADFRYLYYTVSNTASSNVFLSRYDTTGSFTSTGSYTVVDFTKTFNSNVTGVYQTLSTGTELFMLPMGTPGKLYTYQLNANVQSQWYVLDYSEYGNQITECVLIDNTLYFVIDKYIIIKYSNSIFSSYIYFSSPGFVMVGLVYGTSDGRQAWSSNNGRTWNSVSSTLPGRWRSVAYGNGVFVMVGSFYDVSLSGKQAWSSDNGQTWNLVSSPLPLPGTFGEWAGVTYGNGVFVMVGWVSNGSVLSGKQAWSSDNGQTWNLVSSPLTGSWTGVTYGNGYFVMVSSDGKQAWSSDNGLTWNLVSSPLTGSWTGVTYGNGYFVMVGNGKQARSSDNGLTWNLVSSPLSNAWYGVAYGNGVFVMVRGDPVFSPGNQAWSSDNGQTWNAVSSPLSGWWSSVAYGNGVFVMVSENGRQAWSSDNGQTWNLVSSPLSGRWVSTIAAAPKATIAGDGFKNLIAVGNYIYCSTSNVAIQIDTSQDLSTAAAYKFPAPLPINQYAFANGPRYVYMFAQGDNTATNIVRFDPYPPTPLLKTSILVDYESLPPDVPKPDKALLGLVQTQKVTDMNYMNIRGPVKELWVTGMSDSANVFQYSNLTAQSTLALTAGEEIITEDVGTRTFLNTIEPFETHTSMPLRNVSVIPFEFDPESEIPNGTVNFSRIRDQVLSANAETVWARTYNLLAIQGGIGGLIFNS